jgi:cytochrome c
MSIRNMVILSVGLFLAGNALAEDVPALLKKGNCVSCHEVDKKKVGPAFKEVAAKYKDDKAVQANLEARVRSGGKGNWGKIPMPATAKTLSDDDIKAIVKWVVALK